MKLKPLDPIDIAFLVGETRQQMMHVGSLLFYKVPKGKDADVVASEMHNNMLKHEDAYNPFNYKLTKSMGRYFWQEDDEFDITNHVRHIRLPHPGDYKELYKILGVIHGIQLDRTLPLWMMWYISGLPDNRFAVYVKMHHALVDGISGAKMIQMLHSEDPKTKNMPPFWAIDREKTKKDIGSRPKGKATRLEWAKKGLGMAKELASSNKEVLSTFFSSLKKNHVSLTRNDLFYTPTTVFNQEITGARRFVSGSFELNRMKAVGKEIEGSLNDVTLLMMSYATRKYLKSMRQLPKDDMYTLMPVSLRDPDADVGGNQITLVRTRMGTNVPNTKKRIKEVRESLSELKTILTSMDKQQIATYGLLTVAPIFAHIGTGKLPNLLTANTLLSNVPGPKNKLYMNGLELESLYPMSLVLNQQAVNFTVLSYNGQMNVGILGCRTRIPHLQNLMKYMEEGLEDLEHVTGLKPK